MKKRQNQPQTYVQAVFACTVERKKGDGVRL